MPILMQEQLTGVETCPHCGVANPVFLHLWHSENYLRGAETPAGAAGRQWAAYKCTTCGDVVLTAGFYSARRFNSAGQPTGVHDPKPFNADIVLPKVSAVAQSVPERARRYLGQAIRALHTPDGAVMLCASAVDAMLKEKEYVDGTLYSRIEEAAADHVLTSDMAKWAHKVRLDANDPRHADDDKPHVTQEEARQAIRFVEALAEFMFVLPAQVTEGIEAASEVDIPAQIVKSSQ